MRLMSILFFTVIQVTVMSVLKAENVGKPSPRISDRAIKDTQSRTATEEEHRRTECEILQNPDPFTGWKSKCDDLSGRIECLAMRNNPERQACLEKLRIKEYFCLQDAYLEYLAEFDRLQCQKEGYEKEPPAVWKHDYTCYERTGENRNQYENDCPKKINLDCVRQTQECEIAQKAKGLNEKICDSFLEMCQQNPEYVREICARCASEQFPTDK